MSEGGGAGVFDWKRRMGVHEAYHRSRANRVVHCVCIPLELWAVIVALSRVPIASYDLALVAVCVVAPVYLVTEPLLGAAMALLLLGGWWLARVAMDGVATGWALGGAAALFAVTFWFQVRVGHGVFEAGRDDTDKNLAELARTRNPVPILLVFYYHLVEVALAAGYRPALRAEVAAFTAAEASALDAKG